MSDPVDPRPTRPLVDSYSYHSPLPVSLSSTAEDYEEEGESSASGSKRKGVGGGGWMLGIDEAGRGRMSLYLASSTRCSRILMDLSCDLPYETYSRTRPHGLRSGLLPAIVQARARGTWIRR